MTLVAIAGDPDSDSYNTLDELSAYHVAFGNDAWTDGDTDTWEGAARRATVWLDGRYRRQWKGRKTYITTVEGGSPPEQALAWPRCGVADEDGSVVSSTTIPRQIKYAHAEAALRELVSPGSLFPDIERQTIMERVGPLEVQYAPGGEERVEVTIIEDLLDGLLIGDGSSTVHFFSRA
jgi:hypothetical protein